MFPRKSQRLPTMKEYLGAPPLNVRARYNQKKSVSFSDQRPGTPYRVGNPLVRGDAPVWAPGAEWIEQGLKQLPKPQKSALKKFEEDKYPRLKIQTQILDVLELDEGEPKNTKDWPLNFEPPVVKSEKRETFAEFQARMNTRPDGTMFGQSEGRIDPDPIPQQAQAPPTIRMTTNDMVALMNRGTTKFSKAKAVDSMIVFKEPYESSVDGTLSGVRSKLSSLFIKESRSKTLEMELEKLFPSRTSTSTSSKWKNPLKNVGQSNLLHKAQKKQLDRKLGRPGVLQWYPTKKTSGMVLPNGITVTPGGVQIIRDYPPQQSLEDKVAAAKAKLQKPKDPDFRQKVVVALTSSASVPKQAKKVRPTKTDVELTTLTKSMLDGVGSSKISRKLEKFVPRNVKPDQDSRPK